RDAAHRVGVVARLEAARLVGAAEHLIARCRPAPGAAGIGRSNVGEEAHRRPVRTERGPALVPGIGRIGHVYRYPRRIRVAAHRAREPVPELEGARTGAVRIEVLAGELACPV